MSKAKKATGIVGAACLVAAPLVAHFEGKRNKAYLDPVGIATVCVGHTGSDVSLGQVRSDNQCSDILDEDLAKHATGVLDCTPGIGRNMPAFAAATSLAFNIGVQAYCRSTAAGLFRAGKWTDGCHALGRFKYAGGKVLPGLVRRRAAEVKLCLTGEWK